MCLCVLVQPQCWGNKPGRVGLLSLCLWGLSFVTAHLSLHPLPGVQASGTRGDAQPPAAAASMPRGRAVESSGELLPPSCAVAFSRRQSYYSSCHMLTAGFRPHHTLTSEEMARGCACPLRGALLGSVASLHPQRAGTSLPLAGSEQTVPDSAIQVIHPTWPSVLIYLALS